MRFGTGRGTLGEVQDRSGKLLEVRDGLADPQGGPGRFEVPSWRSWTGRGTLGEVRDGLWDPRGGPGRIGGHSGRSGMGRGTLEEVRVLGPSGRSGTGRGTLG